METTIDHRNNPLFNTSKVYGEKTFKISGQPIEVIQALAYVRLLGGGHLRIAKNLLPSKSLYYKGNEGDPQYNNRLNDDDIDIIRTLVQNQKWIKSVEVWQGELVDHDLDKIDYTVDMDNRFNMHPMDRFGKVLKVHWTNWQRLRMRSWLDIPAIPGRPQGKGIIFTGIGWEDRPVYKMWKQQGIANVSVFLGPEEEYNDFVAVTGLEMERRDYEHIGELAQWIEGMQQTITTSKRQWAPAIAQALNRGLMVQSRTDIEGWNNPFVMGERRNNGQF